jgi:hypothetical protein
VVSTSPQNAASVNRVLFIPNARTRSMKLALSNRFHRYVASSSLLVYSAWNMAARSAGVSWIWPARLRCRMSVIIASLIVDAAGCSVPALALCQVAPVARSCSTMPMVPGSRLA